MITTVKILLGIDLNDNSKDQVLDFLSSIMVKKVKNYCNITTIPEDLEDVVAEMVVVLYKKQYGGGSAISIGTGAIKKETVGNHTIEYDVGSASSSSSITQDILNDYRAQLNSFRKIKFV